MKSLLNSRKYKKYNMYGEIFKAFLFCIAFFVYTMLGGVYIFLPPLIGVLYVIFMDIYHRRDTIGGIAIMICLVIYEAENQLPLGVLGLVFLFVNYIITEKLNLIFGHNVFFVFWYIGILYVIYFLVLYTIKMFGSGLVFDLSMTLVYYYVLESSIALVYEKFAYSSKR